MCLIVVVFFNCCSFDSDVEKYIILLISLLTVIHILVVVVLFVLSS